MMKKIMYVLISLALAQNMTMGKCSVTGFACPLKDLNDQKAIINKIQKDKVDNYYNQHKKQPQVEKTERENITIKDLIPFNPRFVK